MKQAKPDLHELSVAELARQPGRVLTHLAILQQVWGPEYGKETQYLRVYSSQLRKNLNEDQSRPHLLTEPHAGYRLVNNSESAAV